MPIDSFEHIFSELDLSRSTWAKEPATVVAAGGADFTVLAALSEAARRSWVHVIVTGEESMIRSVAEKNQIDLTKIEIVDSARAAMTAVELIHQGRGDILMKGQVSTPDLMRAVLDKTTGLRTDETICQVVLMELPRKERSFLLADTGICINPTVQQKVEIMGSAAKIAKRLGADKPRIALMAASEKATDLMPETLDASDITKRFEENDESITSVELFDCYVQGPLSFDLAFDNSAGSSKKIEGPVIGRADVMVFPNLVSANLAVKAIMYTADCKFGGVLSGTKCPVVFMSRSDSPQTRLRSLALALKTTQLERPSS